MLDMLSPRNKDIKETQVIASITQGVTMKALYVANNFSTIPPWETRNRQHAWHTLL